MRQEKGVSRRMFVGGLAAAAFWPFDLPADEGGSVELSDFRLSAGPGRGIAFELKDPKGGELSGWRVFACPKMQCRYHAITPDATYAFPWNAKTTVSPVELKPVSSAQGVLRFVLTVDDPLDLITTYSFRGVRDGAGTATRDASVAQLAKAAGNAAVLDEAKRAYWSQGTKEIPVLREWALGGEKAYTMAKTGTTVVEVTVEGAKPGNPVEIVAWGDNHLKLANDEDRRSDNIMEAFKKRGAANPPDRGCQSLAREMDMIPLFDGAVIMGDNVDFFSYGSYECWKRMVLDAPADPLVVVGYHDYVTYTINKRPQSEMPVKVTMPVCKKYTPNDVHYATKLVGGRVLMVGLDASRNGNFYWEDGIQEKLAADVKRARENGWTILLFQHEGQYLNTWTKGADGAYDETADSEKCVRHTMTGERKMNYRTYVRVLMDPRASRWGQGLGTKAVYDIIWNNADVIRGVFHGHVHANYASWIQAKTPTGELKPIPQYSCHGSVFFEDGWVLKINVK